MSDRDSRPDRDPEDTGDPSSGSRSRSWHSLRAEEAATLLGTDPELGLTESEAELRIATEGPNELPKPHRDGLLTRLGRQLAEPMAVLLLVAAAVAGIGLRERADAIAILAIVILNAAIGLLQEGKAARALEALQEMGSPACVVRRGGQVSVVPASQVARGDLIVLAAGDRVPADLRLVATAAFETDESMLTGESLPVSKDAAALDPPDSALGDRRGMAWSGTLVTRGAATGIAVATGSGSQLGAIAGQIAVREPETPLQKELASLSKTLGAISVAIAAGVMLLTLARLGFSTDGLEQAFLVGVALAVAAVPEGLATVVTVGLALGVRRMATRGAIVRRLPAVETLGCTTVIATDKTGTLTQNQLRLEVVVTAGRPAVRLEELDAVVAAELLSACVLCNDATLNPRAGDPLDLALLDAAGAATVDQVRASHMRADHQPFDSERKRMSTLHEGPAGSLMHVKGAPEAILPLCDTALTPDGSVPLDDRIRAALDDALATLTETGLRVLALASREAGDLEERDLSLVALIGLGDPLRPSARAAVTEARSAGISIVMVTGDHAGTASAIAEGAGLSASEVLTGSQLRESGFPDDPTRVGVYARVDPDQKLELVENLQARGEVVAVTGDGVNDAPALRHADIGVAMGKAGSEVAREAADVVITDDDLATIVTAVREGRGIYDNIRKVVDYLVAGNFSEIAVVVTGLLFFPALGTPLLPLQLLWINLLTDGLPALALGVDPVDPRLMDRPPRPRGKHMLPGAHLRDLILKGSVIATATLASLVIARLVWDQPWPHARTVMFSVLVVAHLMWAFAARHPASARSLLQNRWLVLAVGGGLVLQILVLTLPFFAALFDVAPLSLQEWALVVILGSIPLPVILWIDRARRGGPA